MRYVVLTDAACDLAPDMKGEAGFSVIPMAYLQGGESRPYMPFGSPQDVRFFYRRQREGLLAKTSQITAFQYEAVMRSWLDKGFSVLYLALSGGLSSTYQTAGMTGRKMEEEYPGLRVLVIDTKAATGGMGILAERALRNRKAGMDIAENAADLEDTVRCLHHWFLVSDLMYLKQGGRVSPAAATAGTLFHVHPILEIDPDGKLKVIGKARGKHKAVHELMERYEESRSDSTDDPVYVVDADVPETGDLIEEKLRKNHPGLVIRRCTLSPIIGTHTGPGLAAVIHAGKPV